MLSYVFGTLAGLGLSFLAQWTCAGCAGLFGRIMVLASYRPLASYNAYGDMKKLLMGKVTAMV